MNWIGQDDVMIHFDDFWSQDFPNKDEVKNYLESLAGFSPSDFEKTDERSF